MPRGLAVLDQLTSTLVGVESNEPGERLAYNASVATPDLVPISSLSLPAHHAGLRQPSPKFTGVVVVIRVDVRRVTDTIAYRCLLVPGT